MEVVAVLDRPYVGFPSISVAWMTSVYWLTFCKQINRRESITNRDGLRHS